MEELFNKVCLTCKKGEEEATLSKCPVCFRYYCVDHVYTMAGREFCGSGCARYMRSEEHTSELQSQ